MPNLSLDEPVFILRAQDFTSPKTIILWLAENIETLPEEKARRALEKALAMRDWNGRRAAD